MGAFRLPCRGEHRLRPVGGGAHRLRRRRDHRLQKGRATGRYGERAALTARRAGDRHGHPQRGPEESRYGIGLYVMGKEELMRAVDTAVSRHHGSFEWDILLRMWRISACTATVSMNTCRSSPRWNGTSGRTWRCWIPMSAASCLSEAARIYTKVRDCAPAIYGLHAEVSHSPGRGWGRHPGDGPPFHRVP